MSMISLPKEPRSSVPFFSFAPFFLLFYSYRTKKLRRTASRRLELQWRIYHQSRWWQFNPNVVWHDNGKWRLDRFSETFGRLCWLLSWMGILQKRLWKSEWWVLAWKRQYTPFDRLWWRHTESWLKVADEADKYQLLIRDYRGTAGDCMAGRHSLR